MYQVNNIICIYDTPCCISHIFPRHIIDGHFQKGGDKAESDATSTPTNFWPFDAFDTESMQEKIMLLSPLAIYNGRPLMLRYIFDQFIY